MHRGAALANSVSVLSTLASQLFLHEQIDTTEAKAKALRPYAEKLITSAKRGDLAAIEHVVPEGHFGDRHR